MLIRVLDGPFSLACSKIVTSQSLGMLVKDLTSKRELFFCFFKELRNKKKIKYEKKSKPRS